MKRLCEWGQECFHEAFIFSVGMNRDKSVQICLYEPNGKLSIVTVSNFSSWKKTPNLIGNSEIEMIDCIFQYDHALTIETICGEKIIFHGTNIQLNYLLIKQVSPPKIFGYGIASKHYEKYAHVFHHYFKKAKSCANY